MSTWPKARDLVKDAEIMEITRMLGDAPADFVRQLRIQLPEYLGDSGRVNPESRPRKLLLVQRPNSRMESA